MSRFALGLAVLVLAAAVLPAPSQARPGGGRPRNACQILRPVADVSRGGWIGQVRASPHGIQGRRTLALWNRLDEVVPDPTDDALLTHAANASEFEVRLRRARFRPDPEHERLVQLRVTHRGDFEDATPGYAELREGTRTVRRVTLTFGSVPWVTAAAQLSSAEARSITRWDDLRVLVRSKADSPTHQDLSAVSHIELRIGCPDP